MAHQLFQLPKQTQIDASVRVVPGAKANFYATTTVVPQNTYTDAALTIPSANPVVADANGVFPAIYLNPALTYKLTLTTAADVLIYTVDPCNDQLLSAAVIGGFLYPRTTAEISASVTPTYYSFLPGDIRRYGAVLDGTTDDTTAVQSWLSVGGDLTFPVVASAKITATVNVSSNTTISAAKGATILATTTGFSFFTISGKSNISITGLKFKQSTAGGAAGTIGAIAATTSSLILVDHCEFEGLQWSGVFFGNGTTKSVVRNCYLHDWLGTGNDSGGIVLYEAANDNIVTGNVLENTGWVGIFVQDPYTGNIPKRNVISYNRCSGNSAYGITVYMPNAGDSYNKVIGNDISGVTGSANTALYGSGIYVQGFGAGGTLVDGNNVRDCCKNTTATTNGPAGISIAGLAATGVPVIASNNTVDGMTKYWGILLVTNIGVQVKAIGNSVNHPTGNTTGEPIRAEASSNTQIIGNQVTCSTASGRRCIAVYANSVVMSNVTVSNNTCVGGGDRQIEFLTGGGGTFVRAVITGNIVSGGPASVIPMYLTSIASGVVADNTLSATSTYSLYVNACTKLRLSNNTLDTTGTVCFGTTGTCTGSYFNENNYLGGFIENTGTGLLCSQLTNAAPSSGSSYAIIGDRVIQSVSAVGAAKGWRCTTAGNPGTWTSEGNL